MGGPGPSTGAHAAPALRRLAVLVAVAATAVAAVVVGLVVYLVLARAGLRPGRYAGLSPEITLPFAVVGTALGALGWASARRFSARPRALVAVSTVIVAAGVLGSDAFSGLTITWSASAATMMIHVVVIGLWLTVFSRVMPLPLDVERTPRRPWAGRETAGWRWACAGALLVAGAAWSRLNKPFEGATLLAVSRNHGLTIADLVSVATVVLAVWVVAAQRRAAGVIDGRGPEH